MLPLALALALSASSSAASDLAGLQEITSALPGASLVAHGDLNGDGFVDVISCSSEIHRVVWFAGGPAGPANEPRMASSLPGLFRDIAVADLNGDGFNDIVVVGRNGRAVTWLKNDGTGTFEPVRLLAPNALHRASRLYLVDFDMDGDLEVIVMRGDLSYVSAGPLILNNLGGGVFAPPEELLGLPLPYRSLALFDVDADGLRDVVFSGMDGSTDWFSNPGGAGPWTQNSIDWQPFFRSDEMHAADLDGDGDLDLVLAATAFAEFRIYENLGGGAFGPRIDLGANRFVFAKFELIDADLDGDLDLITTTDGAASLRWIENLGGLQFLERGEFLASGGVDARDLELVDLDADGRADLLVAGGEDRVEWVQGAPVSPAGIAFETDAQNILRPAPGAVDSVALDADLDGIRDVVTASTSAGIFLARGLGGDRFTVPERAVPSIQAASSLRAADIDRSGTEDLVVGTPTGDAWWVPVDATGTLGAPQLIGTGAAPLAVTPEAIDFDGDGDLDILLAGAQSPDVIVHEQLSPGSFAPGRSLISGSGAIRGLVAEDFDLDGELDLIAVDRRPAGSFLELYRGLGAGAFAPPVTAASIPGQLGLHARDLNGDGAADLVWIRPGPRLIQRALNVGGGLFAAPEDLGNFAEGADCVGAGPLGPSGEATLVVYHRRNNRILGTLEWFAIDGPTAISLQQLEVRLKEASSLTLHDVNGDGDLDVLVSASSQGRVGWFENPTIGELGSPECSPAVTNSTGLSAALRVIGSGPTALDPLGLQALNLPAGSTTLFLGSRQGGLVVGPGGSLGTLCLGGMIGRFAAPGQVATASASGFASLSIHLQNLPQPTGSVAAMAGETWRFQAWYRDLAMGATASNFTDAVAILIQ
ncbi:MAG: hypothetical protein ACJA2W_002588 [Planctomycetota bacterium]|jgi:hypothetical protein